MPALSGCASAAAEAVALYERRQRTAAGNVPWRPHGPAGRRAKFDDGRHNRPLLPPRPERRRAAPRLLLLSAAELLSELASRLHAYIHHVAQGRRPDRH